MLTDEAMEDQGKQSRGPSVLIRYSLNYFIARSILGWLWEIGNTNGWLAALKDLSYKLIESLVAGAIFVVIFPPIVRITRARKSRGDRASFPKAQ